MATSHAWAFRPSFRRHAFGWKGTRKAIERLNEAVGEIERMARSDAALAGEGAVLLLETLSPAVSDIDSSLPRDQAAVRLHEGPLPRAGEEHGADRHVVRVVQPVDGAAAVDGSAGMSARAKAEMAPNGAPSAREVTRASRKTDCIGDLGAPSASGPFKPHFASRCADVP